MGVEVARGVVIAAHAVHYAVLGAGLLGVVALLGPQLLDRRPRSLLLPLALAASAAAAGIHAAVTPEHFRESTLFGLFFVGSSLVQLGWCVAAPIRPGRTVHELGVAINAAMVVLWAVTRTIGLPFGLLPRPERVGAWDASCVASELVVVLACALLLRQASRPPAEVDVPRESTVLR